MSRLDALLDDLSPQEPPPPAAAEPTPAPSVVETPTATEPSPAAPFESAVELPLPAPSEAPDSLDALLGGEALLVAPDPTPLDPPTLGLDRLLDGLDEPAPLPVSAPPEAAPALEAAPVLLNPLEPLIEGIAAVAPDEDRARIDRIAELRREAVDRIAETDALIEPETAGIGLAEGATGARLVTETPYVDADAAAISALFRADAGGDEVSFVVRSVRDQRGETLIRDVRAGRLRRFARRLRVFWDGPLGWEPGAGQGRIVSRLAARFALGAVAVAVSTIVSLPAAGSAWGEAIADPLAGSLARPPKIGLVEGGTIGGGSEQGAAGAAYVGLLRAYLDAAASGDPSGLSDWATSDLAASLAGEIAEFGRRGLRPSLSASFELFSPFAPGWQESEYANGVREIRGILLGPVELRYTKLDGSEAAVYQLERLELAVREVASGDWRVSAWRWIADGGTGADAGNVVPSPVPSATPTPAPSATPTPAPSATPTPAPSATTKPTPKPTPKPTTYTVRTGDTIYSIACKLPIGCSSWERLAALNSITGPDYKLNVGDVLAIP